MAAWVTSSNTASNYTTTTNTTTTGWFTISGGTGGTTASFLSTGASNYPYPQPTPDPRVLNRYLNASDLLEEFIRDLKPLGVKQDEVLNVPIELFINWLVIRSAEEDGIEDHDAPALPDLIERNDRCKSCGRYVTNSIRKSQNLFCNGVCLDNHRRKHEI